MTNNKILLEVGKWYKTNIDFFVYENDFKRESTTETLDKYPFLILEKILISQGWFWFKILFNEKIRYICQREDMCAEKV